jgi:hypothetical protein
MAPVPPSPPATSTASAPSTSTAPDILGAVALVSAPSTVADLSGPARALLGALDEGLGAAVGLTTSLSSAGTDAVATLAGNLAGDLAAALGDNVGEIVSDCVEALPVIGSIAKAVVSILTLGLSIGPTDAELCQRLWDRYRPTQTGSALAGGLTVPADIFARVHGVEVYSTDNPDDYAAAHERFRKDPRPRPRLRLPVRQLPRVRPHRLPLSAGDGVDAGGRGQHRRRPRLRRARVRAHAQGRPARRGSAGLPQARARGEALAAGGRP